MKKIQRLPQPLPEELQTSILELLRSKFYTGEDRAGEAKAFAQDRSRLLAWVVRWPAVWLINRGVTLHGDAYRQLFVTVFIQAASHVTSKVTYRPAYLRHVIQQHFAHHGDEIYAAGKSLRTLTEHLVLMAGQSRQPAPDPVARLAEAARLVAAPKRSKAAAKPPVKAQLSLF